MRRLPCHNPARETPNPERAQRQANQAKITDFAALPSPVLHVEWLTRPGAEDYIHPLGASPMLRRDGASAKPLTVYTVNRASGHELVAICSRRRVGCGACSALRYLSEGKTAPQGSGLFDK